jgi:hypothetical protein
MTVPVPTEPSAASPSGRQQVMLQPYISCSTWSPGTVNVSATRSSTTSTTPSAAAMPRIAARTETGSGMSCTHS